MRSALTLVVALHLQRVHKTPAFAPMLFAQGNAVHRHAPVYGFAHVVNGEQADLYGSEGFNNQQIRHLRF